MRRGERFIRPLVFLAALLLPFHSMWADGLGSASTQPDSKAAIIEIKGEIDDYTAKLMFGRFQTARAAGAKTIILDLDTYGGLVTTAEDMSRFLKQQDDLHIICFIRNKAISAGAMIAMACDEIVMASSASLGDCAPIIFGPAGLEAMPPAERAKAESTVLLDFDESARRNHRDPLLAAAMVDVTRVVYWVQNDQGERKFVDGRDYPTLIASKQWHDIPGEKVPIDSDSTLLTVDTDEAIRYGLASGKAHDANALAQERGLTIVADLSNGLGDDLVDLLNGPAVHGLLILIFFLSFYAVLHAPGHGIAEPIGLLALFLMLGVPLLTGHAQWWEILMIFAGLGLIAFEIVLPGHIVPGVSGAILVLLGLVLTFVPIDRSLPLIPYDVHGAYLTLYRGVMVVAGALVASLLLWLWIGRYFPRLPFFNRLIIGQGVSTASQPAKSVSGISGVWPPIGAVGRAISELRPGGRAEFFDPAIADQRATSVVSDSGFLPPGTEIVVRELAGPSIIVRKKA